MKADLCHYSAPRWHNSTDREWTMPKWLSLSWNECSQGKSQIYLTLSLNSVHLFCPLWESAEPCSSGPPSLSEKSLSQDCGSSRLYEPSTQGSGLEWQQSIESNKITWDRHINNFLKFTVTNRKIYRHWNEDDKNTSFSEWSHWEKEKKKGSVIVWMAVCLASEEM